MRVARCSIATASGSISSARAWPALSTPAATRRCTGAGNCSSRMVLEICGRDRLIRSGELLLGAAEVAHHLLVGGGLLQRVQVGPVQVLQQGVAQQVGVLGATDDGRDGRQAGELGGAESPLPHHQLEAAVVQRAHDDRLQQARPRRSRPPARPAGPRRRRCAAAWGWDGSGRPAPRRSVRPPAARRLDSPARAGPSSGSVRCRRSPSPRPSPVRCLGAFMLTSPRRCPWPLRGRRSRWRRPGRPGRRRKRSGR